jgi:hypothetical protein
MGDSTVDVRMVRVDYDIDRAAEGIRASELPDDFAEVLRTGGKSPADVGSDA